MDIAFGFGAERVVLNGIDYQEAKKYINDDWAKIIKIEEEDKVHNIWIPWVHGSYEKAFEISAIREFNWHCRESWGWEGQNKIIVASKMNNYHLLPKETFDELVHVAKRLCENLNTKELDN